MAGRFTAEEERALQYVAKARRDVVLQMFSGTALTFGNNTKITGKKLVETAHEAKGFKKDLSNLGGSYKAKSTGMPTPPGVKQAAEAFIKQCADIDNIQDVVAAIGADIVSQLVAEIVPYVSVAYSTGKLAVATKAVVESGRNLYRHSYYRDGFRPGEPEAAAQSIRIIIERDLTRHSIDAGREAAATGAKIAGLFADLGTGTTAAIGVANTLATLGLKLYALGLDIKDYRAGNAILRTPDNIGLDAFNKCPVLGCYLITCADTSSVANFFLSELGAPGWMDRIEEVKKKQMEPLIKIAKEEIKRSPIQLDGLKSNKGTFQEPSFFAKIKAKVVAQTSGGAKKMQGFGGKLSSAGVRG